MRDPQRGASSEQIIEMARGVVSLSYPADDAELLAFAQLVRNAALEEAADACGFGMSMTEKEIQIADKIKGLKS